MDKLYEDLRKIINESRNIVFFGGAGVSTESGIPDFRSENGLYHAKSKYGRSPEEMLSHSFYVAQPEIFFAYYKENLVFTAEPNAAHIALARLEEMGKLKAVVTQNIDGLHQKAGSKIVFELHGSIERNYCENCRASYDAAYTLRPEACTGADAIVPRCAKCGGIVKPDVVLYEEPLDSAVMSGAIAAIEAADTMIVGGTSLVVYPAAGLLNYFNGKNLVLINKSATPYDRRANLVVNAPIGEVMAAVV
ncbi:MAG: NAD-dependent protein deacylase [Gracilibacteraceae bacterium]|nr:NAD-dependent protein deacylase [Gracilibacteraceae bacterium]